MKTKPSLLLDFFDRLCAFGFTESAILLKKLYFRVARNRQMLGNRITARLCACRYVVDDADDGLSTD